MTATPPLPASAIGPDSEASTAGASSLTHRLAWLYLVRGLAAIVWAAAFASSSHSLGTGDRTLLVVYPLIDVIATLLDVRGQHNAAERMVLWLDAGLSAVAAAALALTVARGTAATLHVFGLWATVSGVAQIIVALRGRGPRAGGQWPMLIAGALSTLVGVLYNIEAFGTRPKLTNLIAYATAGGIFFVLQSASLAWRIRHVGRRG